MRNRLLQLLGDNLANGSGLRAQATDGGIEILVYDVIDAYWGVSAKSVAEAIRGAGNQPLTIRVNSPGGDAFEGRAIASLIRAHKGPTRAIVDGIAASAASTIAIAAQITDMATGAFMMVHNAWTFAMGNAADLQQTVMLLQKVDGDLAADYAKKAGVTAEAAAAWMAQETWFTAQEAVDAGLAANVLDDAASFEAMNLAAYDRTPQALAERISALGTKPADAGPTPEQIRSALERRLRLYETPA